MKADAVITLTPRMLPNGRAFAAVFGLPHVDASAEALVKPAEIARYLRSRVASDRVGRHFAFICAESGLSLAQVDADSVLSIRADFHGGTVRYRREKGGGRSQMIAKAVGLGNAGRPSVLDATAGLGRDAFVLASLGCDVTMTERVPEVRALLADGLARAAEWGRDNEPELIPILERMRLIPAEAITHMRGIARDAAPDVIYLDPMFPPRTKSAQVKKEMRVFHDLVGTDPDAADLLPAALECARKRVVVKRPRVAPTLSSEKPSHTLDGKSNRFDLYVSRREGMF